MNRRRRFNFFKAENSNIFHKENKLSFYDCLLAGLLTYYAGALCRDRHCLGERLLLSMIFRCTNSGVATGNRGTCPTYPPQDQIMTMAQIQKFYGEGVGRE